MEGNIFNEKSFSNSVLNLIQSEGYKLMKWEEILSLRKISDIFLEKNVINMIEIVNNITLSLTERQKLINELASVKNNEEFIRKLQRGIDLLLDNGDIKHLFLINYQIPDINEFIVSNENYFQSSDKNIRIDCICYINGFPLIIMEYKSIFSNKKVNSEICDEKLIDSAIEQVNGSKNKYNKKEGYLQKNPNLFKYNGIVVIANEKIARVGTHMARYEHFSDWLYLESDDELVNRNIERNVEYLIKGLFNKKRFLEYIRHFIFFKEDINNKNIKIHAKYHQFYAVKSLYNSVIKAQNSTLKERNKGGYAYQAPASGKSFEMMMLIHKLQIEDSNRTFLLVTDRNSLDEQLTDTFKSAYKYFGLSEKKSIKVFQSRQELRNVLQSQKASGIIFTTIQKFDDFKIILSERENIIVIIDEAHRTQNLNISSIKLVDSYAYNVFGWAHNMRKSLPNATFVGFTGTPLYRKDNSTKEIFGREVTRYDMKQASEDRTIVPIILQHRHLQVSIDMYKKNRITDVLEEELQLGTNQLVLKKLQSEYAREEKLILSNNRFIEKIAKDIVEDYTNEIKNSGSWIPNAMLIVSSRSVALKYYKEIVEKIKPEWKNAVEMVVSTQQQDDIELIKYLGKVKFKATNFKDQKHSFRFVILVDMWTTGFDTPQVKKMYLVKRIKEHTLIQTISRVTRIYKDKKYGTVIDYLGLQKSFEEASKIYTNEETQVMSNSFEPIKENFKKNYEKLRELFSNQYDEAMSVIKDNNLNKHWKPLKIANNLINKYRLNKIAILFDTFSNMWKDYILLPVDESNSDEKEFIAVARLILDVIKGERLNQDDYGNLKRIRHELDNILDDILSIEEQIISKGIINVSKNMFGQPLEHIEIMMIIKEVDKKLQLFKKENIIRANELSERIDSIIERYNNNEIGLIEVNALVALDYNEMLSIGIKLKEVGIVSREEAAFYDIIKMIKKDIDDFLAVKIAKELNLMRLTKNWKSYFENPSTIHSILLMIRDLLNNNNIFTKEEIHQILKRIEEQTAKIN